MRHDRWHDNLVVSPVIWQRCHLQLKKSRSCLSRSFFGFRFPQLQRSAKLGLCLRTGGFACTWVIPSCFMHNTLRPFIEHMFTSNHHHRNNITFSLRHRADCSVRDARSHVARQPWYRASGSAAARRDPAFRLLTRCCMEADGDGHVQSPPVQISTRLPCEKVLRRSGAEYPSVSHTIKTLDDLHPTQRPVTRIEER